MLRFDPLSGLKGVRTYIENQYGEYKMNGDLERNISVQRLHEKLSMEVIKSELNVSLDQAKSIYGVAYYHGHAHGLAAIDTYVETAISSVKLTRV